MSMISVKLLPVEHKRAEGFAYRIASHSANFSASRVSYCLKVVRALRFFFVFSPLLELEARR